MSAIYPVILSGGSGTRLWPLSRSMYPKQFIRFFNGQSSSFLGATLTRLDQRSGLRTADPALQQRSPVPGEGRAGSRGITPRAHRSGADRTQYRTSHRGRRARCVARQSQRRARSHAVRPCREGRGEFVAAVRRAAKVAQTGKLVLFGIKPTEPHTGYGYIRHGANARGLRRRRIRRRCVLREAEQGDGRKLCRGRQLLLEQRHLRAQRPHVPGGAGTARAAHPGCSAQRSRRCRDRPGDFLRLEQGRVRKRARTFRSTTR